MHILSAWLNIIKESGLLERFFDKILDRYHNFSPAFWSAGSVCQPIKHHVTKIRIFSGTGKPCQIFSGLVNISNRKWIFVHVPFPRSMLFEGSKNNVYYKITIWLLHNLLTISFLSIIAIISISATMFSNRLSGNYHASSKPLWFPHRTSSNV